MHLCIVIIEVRRTRNKLNEGVANGACTLLCTTLGNKGGKIEESQCIGSSLESRLTLQFSAEFLQSTSIESGANTLKWPRILQEIHTKSNWVRHSVPGEDLRLDFTVSQGLQHGACGCDAC